jgi:hypothetical protein
MGVKLRKRGSFPGIPPETSNAIRDVEANVSAAVDELSTGKRSAWSEVNVVSGDVSANPWDMIVSNRNVTILLPHPTLQIVGHEIAAVRMSGTMNVKAIDSLVDGSATSSGPGLCKSRIWICTLKGWHSVA